ncbi:HAD-superfamily phosphatase [Xylona heveae TC161]|uniref:HAD-superfamily phosphatase n=1 Tax=Xylona heveae (strain CBS 132557 / TC161) TaxID=1328760 RepID=A0A165JSL4_XYLHT|nr:HAD-superfamily phosphatase [Xylona heveae TC161]KZF26573.1 HAD-superfamily phosphatase [Xylona heveae TC161]
MLNLSATLSVFKLFFNPSLCLPHSTVSNFSQLPIPLSRAFIRNEKAKEPDIRAVVLDKDDCFAIPHHNEIYKDYESTFRLLRETYPGRKLLIVSNSAGTTTEDPSGREASILEAATDVPVLRHSTKKPGCGAQIMSYFQQHSAETGVTHPSQIAIVGDRLLTDVMMANDMGAWGVWIKDGVVPEDKKSVFSKFEKKLHGYLTRRGYAPPTPQSPFE